MALSIWSGESFSVSACSGCESIRESCGGGSGSEGCWTVLSVEGGSSLADKGCGVVVGGVGMMSWVMSGVLPCVLGRGRASFGLGLPESPWL